MNKLSQKKLVDQLMDAYVSWREACRRVSDAYGSWGSGTGQGATSAFEWYVAALDHEERAAEIYASLVRRACRLASINHDAAGPLGGAAQRLGLR